MKNKNRQIDIKIESEINTALSSFLHIQLGGPEVIDGSNAVMNMKGLENSDGNKYPGNKLVLNRERVGQTPRCMRHSTHSCARRKRRVNEMFERRRSKPLSPQKHEHEASRNDTKSVRRDRVSASLTLSGS